MDIKAESGQLIKLTDLAPHFVGHIAEHLRHSPKQATSASSKFLDACKSYAIDSDDKEKLVDQTVRHGFNNVIDAFHIVGSGEVPKRFYIDERSRNQGIRITDEFSKLLEGYQSVNLLSEVESRWRLVEMTLPPESGSLNAMHNRVYGRCYGKDKPGAVYAGI